MYLWPEEFKDNQYLNGTVQDLVSNLDSVPFMENQDVLPYKDRMRDPFGETRDAYKEWFLLG